MHYLAILPQKKVYTSITLVGLVQALFGMLLFISKRPRHVSFVFLVVWFGIIAVFLGALLLPFEVVTHFKPGIFPVLLLFGPLLYFYLQSLTIEDFRLKPRQLLHLLPLLLVSLHRSVTPAVPITSSSENPLYVYNKVYYAILILSLFYYWLSGLKLVLKHRKNIRLHFSNYTRANSMSWLALVLSLFLVLFMVDFTRFFFHKVWQLEVPSLFLLPVNLTIFVFIMVFFGINQSVIYTPEEGAIRPETNGAPLGGKKYTGSSITGEEIEKVTQAMLAYLTEAKPYLNPEYSLQQMASDLNISRHKLSQVINSGQNKNFFKLVNEYRIREAKKMLLNPAYDHYSILGIGYACGFNSKSSFNRLFKEETGCTPSEFKQEIRS